MEVITAEFSLLAAAVVVLRDTGAPIDTGALPQGGGGLHAAQARIWSVRHPPGAAAKPLPPLAPPPHTVVQDERNPRAEPKASRQWRDPEMREIVPGGEDEQVPASFDSRTEAIFLPPAPGLAPPPIASAR